MTTTLLWYVLTGMLAGTLSGLYGIGGGMVTVPMLSHILRYSGYDPSIVMHVAASTSLCIMVFTTQASVRAHHQYTKIDWSLCQRLLPGIMFGALLGVLVSDAMPTQVLERCFGVFLIGVALRFLLVMKRPPNKPAPSPQLTIVITIVIGFSAALLGVGGGVLMIPFLSRYQVPMRQAIGIAALCSLALALVGACTSMFTGANATNLPPWHTGYINWVAVLCIAASSIVFVPFGAWLSHRLPLHLLKRCFAGVLLAVGVHLLL